MAKITDVRRLDIIDSRGNPAIAATVALDSSLTGCPAAPSGASTGSRQAVELSDKEMSRGGGMNVLQ